MFNNFKTKAIAAAVALVLPMGASAAVIDFDSLASGPLQSVPLTQFSEEGRTFSLSFTGHASGPAIFDTRCVDVSATNNAACNNDVDLVPRVQGENGVMDNILILQEIGSNVPDDAAVAGSITLTLIGGDAFKFTGASAVDDTDFTFSTNLDGLLGTISNDRNRETGKTTFQSSLLSVNDSITITYGGSGGVDSLRIAAVPVPAALPLLAAALGGFGFMARRKRKAA